MCLEEERDYKLCLEGMSSYTYMELVEVVGSCYSLEVVVVVVVEGVLAWSCCNLVVVVVVENSMDNVLEVEGVVKSMKDSL